MTDLDLKDRKILYQLDLNCRQSNAQIGKKVGLSKQVVDYRIKRMEQEGIITGYWTAINTLKLGYYCFRIYINFLNVSSDLKNEIIQYFMNYKNIWAILTAKVPIDFDAVLWVDDMYDFNQFWNKTLDKYGNYFEKYSVSIVSQVIVLKNTYLILDENKKSDYDRDFYITSCRGEKVKIDETDYQLLNEIALNARILLVELAKKLGCSSQTILYKINNLMKKDIIQAFRVVIDTTKLGLQNCAIEVYLKDYKKRIEIINYVKSIPYVFDIIDMQVGWCDFNFEVMVPNIDKLNKITDELERKFPGSIRKTQFWMSKVVHKERWLPEMTKADFKKI